MASIRVLLPPLRALAVDTPLAVAVGDKTAWRRYAPLSLAELGRRWPGAKVTAFLHPEDLTLTAVAVPPLARARLRIAVQDAIEPLALGDGDSLRVGHGARGADGRVPVAWLDGDAADALQARIAACGLAPVAFAPASLWLPETAGGWTLWQLDGYLIARQADGVGALYALEDGNPAEPSAARVMGADAQACALGPRQWIDRLPAWWQPPIALPASPDACDIVLPEAACGVMAAMPWSLPALQTGGAASTAGWRTAIALAAAAALVWMGGLGLYAWRLDQAVQDARQQLAQAVRDAFPAVGAVVDPLGQAKRQLALRQGGSDDWAELGFLLRAASEHMAFAAGEVQAWRYEAGGLELDLPPAARPKPAAGVDEAQAAAPAWVQAARQGGVQVQATPTGWRLRRAPPPASGKPAQRS
ncbi:type II secretion system protein GspL [Achromobacter sp. UMC71]|uniref:type II secretion system protein GspL n=1 Tax=Achromobacter sp. UMC71 TaxID=1862320 RepID=UPI0016026B30|nr:type II secretion system protein GspL [Achromobacter sp. UMC71]MBB1627373.1 hypothetical protein [Achromobacter sp. UMC71]